MRRRSVACAIAAASMAAGCQQSPAEVTGRFEPADRPPVAIRVVVQPEHRGNAMRYVRAAVASLATLNAWVGPYPGENLTLVDPPWRVREAAASPAILLDRTPAWTTATSMAPELATSRAIARRMWSDAVDASALPPWFIAGLVEYSARRSIAPL